MSSDEIRFPSTLKRWRELTDVLSLSGFSLNLRMITSVLFDKLLIDEHRAPGCRFPRGRIVVLYRRFSHSQQCEGSKENGLGAKARRYGLVDLMEKS